MGGQGPRWGEEARGGGGPGADRSVINAGTRGGRQTKIINIYHSRFPACTSNRNAIFPGADALMQTRRVGHRRKFRSPRTVRANSIMLITLDGGWLAHLFRRSRPLF